MQWTQRQRVGSSCAPTSLLSSSLGLVALEEREPHHTSRYSLCPIPRLHPQFPKLHSQTLIPKFSFQKTHSQSLIFRRTSPISRAPFSESHIISELHSQFSELHFPTASSFLVLPFTADCTQVATLFFYSQQCVSLTEALMPLCSTRLSPPRQPSIVSTVTTTLFILMQTSPN